jgi:hypothetical protein
MKLCPLFESIQTPHKQRLEPPASFYDGLVAANNALPREAIEAAIDCIKTYDPYLKEYIEQLRAMLPEGEMKQPNEQEQDDE